MMDSYFCTICTCMVFSRGGVLDAEDANRIGEGLVIVTTAAGRSPCNTPQTPAENAASRDEQRWYRE
jgi:hypothetical protein